MLEILENLLPVRKIRRTQAIRMLATAVAMAGALHIAVAAAEGRGSIAKVGELWFSTPDRPNPWREAFHEGLRDLGYSEGKNLQIISLYAGGDEQRFAGLIDELIHVRVDVMFLLPQTVPIAKAKTATLPIVSAGFGDPVAEGLVASLAHPGGNVTGLSWDSPDMSAKRLELALEFVPHAKRVAILFDTGSKSAVLEAKATENAVRRAGLQAELFPVRDRPSLEAAFPSIVEHSAHLLIVIDTSLTVTHRHLLAAFAKKARIPLVAEDPEFANAGALFTYGASSQYMYRRAASYVDRILKGTNPGDIPIEQPREFEFVLNATTVEALGLKLPQSAVLRAPKIVR